MPWSASEASEKTRYADTEELRELWAKVANERLASGASEESAIKQANAVVHKEWNRHHRKWL